MVERQTFEKFRAQFERNIFDTYDVAIRLRDVAGGTPADPRLIEAWIKAMNKDKSDEERAKIVAATIEALPGIVDSEASASWCRFKRDEKGVYMEGRQIKAGLKEASNIIKSTLRDKKGEKGITALKSKVAECVFVVDEKIYMLRDGQPITGEIPTEERPIHVMTRQGPRTSLKRVDVLKDVEIKFAVRLALTGAVSEEALFGSLAYLQYLGLGADRSQGRGQATDIRVTLRE